MRNENPVYHPISMLSMVAQAINGSYENVTELCTTFSEQEHEHGSLNDDELKRARAVFEGGIEYVPYFAEQLRRWEQTNLTPFERQEVIELTKTNSSLIKLYTDGIALIDRISPYTIDKIMAMNDVELALKILSGEIKSPRK